MNYNNDYISNYNFYVNKNVKYFKNKIVFNIALHIFFVIIVFLYH